MDRFHWRFTIKKFRNIHKKTHVLKFLLNKGAGRESLSKENPLLNLTPMLYFKLSFPCVSLTVTTEKQALVVPGFLV